MWQNSEIARRLELAAPILQGPFGGGLSTPRLAAAVSNSGGLGSYGAYTLAPDEIAKVARDIRALTSRPFALNRWVDEMTPRLRELPPFPIQAWFSAKLKAAAAKAGRTDLVALWAGQATPNLRHRTAPELMASLMNADLP